MRIKLEGPHLEKIRGILTYLYSRDFAEELLRGSLLEAEYSRRTGRIRHVYVDGVLVATVRASDGFVLPTLQGFRKVVSTLGPCFYVRVREDAEPYVARGRSVFAKHVVDFDERIYPGLEVAVLREHSNEVIAVGRCLFSPLELRSGIRGVCVRVRQHLTSESQ